jgi:hypothetical protein
LERGARTVECAAATLRLLVATLQEGVAAGGQGAKGEVTPLQADMARHLAQQLQDTADELRYVARQLPENP